MEFVTKALDLVLDQKFLLISCSGVFAITLWRITQQYKHGELGMHTLIPFGLFNAILVFLASVWLSYVNASVPAPYLDEFFHIPQTQVYCRGRYSQWDDKITTPPGLYLATIAWARLVGKTDCSVQTLRQFNVVAILGTSLFATLCQFTTTKATRSSPIRSNFVLHSAFNIALFPVLFFFSGLFYTDVLSTCVVLAAYSNHSARISRTGPPQFLNDLYTVALGICALFMRQTNVFWVVVYMGGLEAVTAIKSLSPKPAGDPRFTTLQAQLQFYASRYSQGHVHDPPVGDAWPSDLALCVVSLACAAVCNPFAVLRRIYPHIITLALFVAFVIWNGGVVLGDKSNHVATLHLAQMLYIWPLFAFFSAPLFLPQALRFLNAAYRFVTWSPPSPATSQAQKPNSHSENKSAALKVFNAVFSNGPLLSILLVIACLTVGLVIVHFNTIIHPFTLADNRHYMFYIFRYSILRGSLVRHAIVPVYVFCGWLSWSTLYHGKACGSAGNDSSNAKIVGKKAKSSVSASQTEEHSLSNEVSQSPPTSTILIFLLTTTLSLMTAPLVEPRYFILPWVFWRLLVPAWSVNDIFGTLQAAADKPSSTWLVGIGDRFDVRLFLESVWFLLINGITMYIFLTKPFYWKAADGTVLDGGNVQRFMW